ncbi:MAG: quinoprotein dehydrogenase-associated SoxYZ-like carrier [Burkholderiales bacterium]|nr:quinoprotein dehydrogenase-associated SoxYZ-like carrier [Burkholderiales bacterium]
MKHAVVVLCWVGLVMNASAATADADAAPDIWALVRTSLFGDRPIHEPADDVVRLRVPARAADAAVVPLAVSLGSAQSDDRYVKALYVVIDRNPSPVAAIFRFTPRSGRADIETRVRVEEYTHVRAIAEMNTGELYAATRYVKAAGGCSAPAAKSSDTSALGRMRLVLEDGTAEGTATARLSVMHPNHSGLAMDQFTRYYTPAYFVRSIAVSYRGEPVMTADVDFSISENPSVRFHFIAREAGELKAQVVDTKDLTFETVLDVNPLGAGKASAEVAR